MNEACDAFRRTIEDRLDGPVDAERSSALDAHLRLCPECREAAEGLAAVRSALRGMPTPSMPDDVLATILARTIDSAPRTRKDRPFWSSLAAAAVLVVSVAGALWVGLGREPTPTASETARAEKEARYVLAIASAALRRGERVAVREVLEDEVAPAVRRIPLHWKDASGAGSAPRRNGT